MCGLGGQKGFGNQEAGGHVGLDGLVTPAPVFLFCWEACWRTLRTSRHEYEARADSKSWMVALAALAALAGPACGAAVPIPGGVYQPD